MRDEQKDDSPQNRDADRIPLTEWIVASGGLLLVAASFGFLAYRAIGEKRPPSFECVVEQVEVFDQNCAVRVAVKNDGGRPVANVCIRATVEGEHDREAVLDYVPAGSSRRLTFLFDKPVREADLNLSVVSFTDP